MPPGTMLAIALARSFFATPREIQVCSPAISPPCHRIVQERRLLRSIDPPGELNGAAASNISLESVPAAAHAAIAQLIAVRC
jgi:hypothetical protein